MTRLMARSLIAVLLWSSTMSIARAEDKGLQERPEKAVCRTCELRGSDHGPEKVVASREYEGVHYHFCSSDCAEAFDTFPAGYARQPLPRPAPRLAVTTLDGRMMQLGSPGGGPKLVDFWATWCGPCIEAMPHLEKLHKRWEESGLVVIGVSIDEGTAKKVPELVAKKKLSYPIALDSAEDPAWYAFNVAAIPALFLVDNDGQIIGEWRGRIDQGDVTRSLEALLEEVPAGQ